MLDIQCICIVTSHTLRMFLQGEWVDIEWQVALTLRSVGFKGNVEVRDRLGCLVAWVQVVLGAVINKGLWGIQRQR